MKQRIMTGVVGGLFMFIITFIGGGLYDFVYFGITCIAIYEVSKLFFGNGFDCGAIINYILAFVLMIIDLRECYAMLKLVIFVFIAINFMMFVFNKSFDIKKVSKIILIASYIVFFMYHMLLLGNTKFSWLVYIIAFGTDTCAYFTGKFLGRHKLYPQVSPNKTIEGAIGGVIGCTLLSVLYFYFLGINKYICIIIFSICASGFSMIGDLTASKIKREFKIKDFGTFLPGHGGIMDRFDSVLFVAPIVYYFVNNFI